MRLDIPIWVDFHTQCSDYGCASITQTTSINVLQPDILFSLGIGVMFGVITYLVYKHESKKGLQKNQKVNP